MDKIHYEVIAETKDGKTMWGPFYLHEEAEGTRIYVVASWRGPAAEIYVVRVTTTKERL